MKAILMKCEVKEKGSENKHKFQSPTLDLLLFLLIQGHHKYILQEQSDRTFRSQPEDLASRECLKLSLNLTQASPNATVNARNTLPKPKNKPRFVIVNVHHSIIVDELKVELLNNNAMNVNKVTRITSRATGQPTKLIRVITDSNNHVSAAKKHGVKLGWQLYQCEASREPPHVMQCFK